MQQDTFRLLAMIGELYVKIRNLNETIEELRIANNDLKEQIAIYKNEKATNST